MGRRRRILVPGCLLALATACGRPDLRVCADPDNLPFSDRAGEGFENRIAAILADDLGRNLTYVWWPQLRGYIRKTLDDDRCDVWMGVAGDLDRLATTRPYYRSTYVFVTPAGASPPASLDDPRLRTMRIGVQLVGDDGANTPPAHALARRGIIENVRGYMIYADRSAMIDALSDGLLDVALMWGPQAAWFARQAPTPLTLTPVTPWLDGPRLPMAFDISVGVRKQDGALHDDIQRALTRRRAEVNAVLTSFDVPQVGSDSPLEASIGE